MCVALERCFVLLVTCCKRSRRAHRHKFWKTSFYGVFFKFLEELICQLMKKEKSTSRPPPLKGRVGEGIESNFLSIRSILTSFYQAVVFFKIISYRINIVLISVCHLSWMRARRPDLKSHNIVNANMKYVMVTRGGIDWDCH